MTAKKRHEGPSAKGYRDLVPACNQYAGEKARQTSRKKQQKIVKNVNWMQIVKKVGQTDTDNCN
jgi:hypothetical protein